MRRAVPTLLVMATALLAACCTGSTPENRDNAETPPPAESKDATVEEATLSPDGEHAFQVAGAHGFKGRLVYNDGGWRLDGTFTFHTAGYSVGEPFIMMLKRYPVHVNIRIPVTAPPIDALVAQVITEETVETTVEASADATFSVFIETNRVNDER